MRALGRLALVAVGLALSGLLALYLGQRRILFVRPADVRPPELGEIVQAQGAAWLWSPPTDPEAPVVVHFHGTGGQVSDEVFLAGWLAESGAGFAAVEYPGIGYAEGEPTEASLIAAGRAALRELTGPVGIARERIVLMGHSLGTGVAVALAAEGWGSRLLLVSPFTSVADVAAERFPFLPAQLLVRDRFDSRSRAVAVRVPTLVLHGDQDQTIALHFGQALAEALPDAELAVLAGAGHADLWQHPSARGLAVKFLRWGPGPHGDRGDNGLWMRRVWPHEPRDPATITALVQNLRARGVRQIYPFLGPLGPDGRPGWRDGDTIRPYDPETARAFFAAAHAADPSLTILPWTGGVYPRDVVLDAPGVRMIPLPFSENKKDNPSDFRSTPERFRARFAAAMAEIVALGADGVQINVEPMPTGHPGYLALLESVRVAIGPDAILAVAAYPPTTPLHDFPDVHWDLDYLAEVCRRADDLAIMAYDTALTDRATYAGLVAQWTEELAAALPPPSEGGCTWRMGLPAYEDDEAWHRPDVETLEVALRGLNHALQKRSIPEGFRGVALYASWTLDAAEWATYDTDWRNIAPVEAPLLDETPR